MRPLALVLLIACVPVGGFDAGVMTPIDAGASVDAGVDAGQPAGWKLMDFAGTGTAGLMDGPIALAQFNQPTAIAIDEVGQLFVADTGNRVIRKIDLNGEVTTISQPVFVEPQGIAVDSRGIVYVSDTREQCVKSLDTTGRVRSFSGTCTMGQMGFHRCYDSSPGTVGPGDIAGPMGLAADSDAGIVYIADLEHQLVRFASTRSSLLGTLAGRADTFSFLDGPCAETTAAARSSTRRSPIAARRTPPSSAGPARWR